MTPTIASLQAQIDLMKEQSLIIANYHSDVLLQQAKIHRQTRVDLEEANRMIASLRKTRAKAFKDLDHANGLLKTANGRSARLADDLEALQTVVDSQDNEIEELKRQLSNLGQRLDALRNPPKAPAITDPACGSVVIGSTYDRDLLPRK